MMYHISMSIKRAEEMVRDSIKKRKQQYIFMGDNGEGIDNFKLIRLLNEYKAKGYTMVPVCDKVNKDGGCAGHKSKKNKTA